MEAFFKTHAHLVEHTTAPVRRLLMDEINWNDRLIAIKGARGVGKTTFLLQYAREHFSTNDHKCLFVGMNNFHFQQHGLFDFACNFHRMGGQVLLVDQAYKLPHWQQELRRCYDNLPALKIVFTGSCAMKLDDEETHLSNLCSCYTLRGFSLREFINLRTGKNFSHYSFQDILERHEMIAANILRQEVNPLDHIRAYLKHGFYPFFLEQTNYTESLLKSMNMTVEVDILLIHQIEQKYLHKIKRLLYLLASDAQATPNVSQLATDMQTSRATVMGYLKLLSDAQLLNMVYRKGEYASKKPARITLHDTNQLFAIFPRTNEEEIISDTFFQQNVGIDHQIFIGDRSCNYFVENKKFRLCNEEPHRFAPDIYYLRTGITKGHDKQLPLWLLGFMY
ncbi:MAG: ATP-binding protein [Bacteroidales bacterium]|nr:ATP-binding protein [Candidatus Physcousia equi]